MSVECPFVSDDLSEDADTVGQALVPDDGDHASLF